MKQNASKFVSVAVLGALACLLAPLIGCRGQEDPFKAMIEPFVQPTPGEVARDAFNVYDADKRQRAVSALSASKFGGEPAYLRMYRLLIDDADPTVRAACVKALGLHGHVEDAALLVGRLDDPVAIVRWEAAKALQRIHAPDAVSPLITVLRDDADGDVRSAAAYALGQYPTIEVFQALVGALDDRKFGVVSSARRSLRLLTGYDFGSDGAAWLIWSNNNAGQLFQHQKTYTYMPYRQPRGMLEKAQFWKDAPPPAAPMLPKGAGAADADERASSGS